MADLPSPRLDNFVLILLAVLAAGVFLTSVNKVLPSAEGAFCAYFADASHTACWCKAGSAVQGGAGLCALCAVFLCFFFYLFSSGREIVAVRGRRFYPLRC